MDRRVEPPASREPDMPARSGEIRMQERGAAFEIRNEREVGA